LPNASCWYLGELTLWSWRCKRYAPLKRQWTSTKLHGITSEYYVLFIVATVTAVKPAKMNVWSTEILNDSRFRNDLCGEFYSPFMGKHFRPV
jgi:hypothetical protein